MKRIISAFMLVLVLLLCGCGGTNGKDTMEDEALITVDRLFEVTGLSREKYSDIDIEQFIEYWELTEDNVSYLNIEFLLDGFEEDLNRKDVSDIFDARKSRFSNFTEDAVAIAFHENAGTSHASVYYDLENSLRYKKDPGYVFDDLNSVNPEKYDKGQELLQFLNDQGVFSWKSRHSSLGIMDGISVELVVKYSDGTVFKFSTGTNPELLPDNYETVRDKLME